MNIRQTIARRLEKQHSVRQERREGFTDDNEAVYAELQRLLRSQSDGGAARGRGTSVDGVVRSLGGSRESQDRSQEADSSLDFSQASGGWEVRFLDSDLASSEGGHQRTVEQGRQSAASPDPGSHLSLGLEDSPEETPPVGIDCSQRGGADGVEDGAGVIEA